MATSLRQPTVSHVVLGESEARPLGAVLLCAAGALGLLLSAVLGVEFIDDGILSKRCLRTPKLSLWMTCPVRSHVNATTLFENSHVLTHVRVLTPTSWQLSCPSQGD